MNIEKENTGQLEATIKVKLTEDDYREQVEKELKNTQKKAQMPGFRPGKVPAGMIRKLYGKSILAEQVNKIMADAVLNYIKEEELEILGSPLPDSESTGKIDFENQDEFEFHYKIGLKPAIDLELSEDIEIDYHKIIVPDERVDEIVNENCKRHGNLIYPGVAEEGDVLNGVFTEVDEANNPVEGGKENKTSVFIHFIKDPDIKDQFVGAKPGSEVFMDILKAVESETEAAAMIGVKKEDLKQYSPYFRFSVENISRIEPAELNEELFEKIAPGKDIKTEEALRQFLKEQMSLQYQSEVDKHFRNEISEKLINITNLSLPGTFLKKWMLENNKEKLSEQQIEEEFEKFAEGFKWQLIEGYLIKKYNIEVKPEEVDNQLQLFIRAQLARYGQQDLPKEIMDKYLNELRSKKEEVEKVYDYLFEIKLISLLKEKIKLHEIEISLEDFNLMLAEKYKENDESDISNENSIQESETETETESDSDSNTDTKNVDNN